MSSQTNPGIRDRSKDGFVRGLCCRDFRSTKVIWTQEGCAVIQESLLPLNGGKAHLGMWIWCKVRRVENGYFAYMEKYRYLVTEYEEAPAISGVVVTKKNNHFLMVDIDIWMIAPSARLYESDFFLNIFDIQTIIRIPDMGKLYRVRLRNTPVDDGDGCLRIKWHIVELKATKTRIRPSHTALDLNGRDTRNINTPPTTEQPSTSYFAGRSMGTTSKAHTPREMLPQGWKSAFQNDRREETQSSHYTEKCGIHESNELLNAESLSESAEDENQGFSSTPPCENAVPPSPSRVPSDQNWEQIFRHIMIYKNVRSAMRDSNPDLLDQILEKLLERY